MYACDAVELDFLDTAPLRRSVTTTVARPPEEVFAAVVHDPANWGEFFPGFDMTGRYTTPAPHGVGARRTIRVARQRVDETILAWDEGTRRVFRVDAIQVPVFHAFLEDYRFEPDGAGGTRLSWNVACTPRLAFTLARPVLPLGMRLMLGRAGHNLERGRWFTAGPGAASDKQ